MSDEIFAKARRSFETLPGPGLLQHAMEILAREGVPLPRIRSWAVSIAREFGIWSYVSRDFPRMLGIACNAAIERGRSQLQSTAKG